MYELDCGGDKLCGKRNMSLFCPYYDEPTCALSTINREPTSVQQDKGMSLDAIADVIQETARQYKDGILTDKEFRALIGGIGLVAMQMSHRQADMMINAAKMDIVSKQLCSMLDNKEEDADA